MPKKSVLGHPDNVPRLSREGFNLSQTFTFTASTGQLLPVWYDLLNPGETVKGNPSFLLRSDHFLAPAMADVDCYVELFFVPMQKIFSPFGEWFYQIDDLRSDYFLPENFTGYLPICGDSSGDNPFSQMSKTIFNSRQQMSVQPFYYPENYGFGMHRLLMHLGYNPQALFYDLVDTYNWQDEQSHDSYLDQYKQIVSNVSCPNFSPYLFCAYQGIYYDYYRNTEFESNCVKAYNLDSTLSIDDGMIYMDSQVFSGNYERLPMFLLRYRWKNKDYFTSSRLSPLYSGVSMLPDAASNLSKVNQWLTDGTYNMMTSDLRVNPSDPSDPANTFTQFGQRSSQSGIIVQAQNNSVIWPDITDYRFNSSFESVDGSGSIHSDPDGYLLSAEDLGTGQVRNSHTHNLGVNLPEVKLTTARIRTMFALEKLQRVTQRAGKHYDDQTLAHFGFKVNQGMSGEVYKIKSWHSTLGIQKVTSTSDTEGAALGEQAAVGYALLDSRKNGFKFTAPCHGIVMAIWSAAPRYKYIGAVDKLGMKTTLWDFYKPAQDNLGSQPIFGYEFGGGHNKGVAYEDDKVVDTSVQGWQWRFMESKVKYDRTSLVFATVSKNSWSIAQIPNTLSFSPFVCPTDLNTLINAQYDPEQLYPEDGSQQDHVTWVRDYPASYLRDPFTVDFYMSASKVSTMTTFGDLSLNGI